jgi:hypothetical protein
LVVFSSKVGREKKKSGDRSVNGYLRLWLACPLLSACCCWGIIHTDLRSELSTHLVPQALFTQSPVRELLLQAFPFPSTLGKVTLHLLSQVCVFIYSPRGKWVFPPFLWSFPPSTTLTSFPAPGCWECIPAPTRASPARPGSFIYSCGKDSPPPLFGAQGVPPSLLCVFTVLVAYYSVSLFSPGGGQSVQRAMLICSSVVFGNTMYRLAHLVCVFPSRLSMGDWQPGVPPGFSI